MRVLKGVEKPLRKVNTGAVVLDFISDEKPLGFYEQTYGKAFSFIGDLGDDDEMLAEFDELLSGFKGVSDELERA